MVVHIEVEYFAASSGLRHSSLSKLTERLLNHMEQTTKVFVSLILHCFYATVRDDGTVEYFSNRYRLTY